MSLVSYASSWSSSCIRTTVRIVLTGHTQLELMMAAVNSGAIARYYTKPWDNDQLLENVRSAFQQHCAAHAVGTLEAH